jgi:hypothetical protein
MRRCSAEAKQGEENCETAWDGEAKHFGCRQKLRKLYFPDVANASGAYREILQARSTAARHRCSRLC